jgi:large subunit ribosomal protein L25
MWGIIHKYFSIRAQTGGNSMERRALTAEVRTLTGKGHNRKLRYSGKVPGIVYGMKGKVVPLQLDRTALQQAINTPAGHNVLLDLNIAGGKKETVMIRDLTRDIMRRDLFTHVDFIRVSLKEKLEVHVPLVTTGEPRGLKEGGVPQIQLREITLLCLPTDIPEHISIDVSELQVGESLSVQDIQFPPGIEVLHEPGTLVFSVLAPRVEEEPAEAEAAEGDGIEEAAPAADAEGAGED